MKKIILILLIVMSFVVPLSAFTWSGVVDSKVAFSGAIDNLAVDETNRLTMSFYAPFKTSVPMSLTGDCFYEFGFNKPLSDGDGSISHKLDIGTLNYNVKFNSVTVDFGRFPVVDVTGFVLAMPIDGAKVSFANDFVTISSYIGFTGLLNSKSVNINAAENTMGQSIVYSLASPFVVANVNLYMPQLFAGQDLFTEVVATIDVAGTDTPNNRVYATMAMAGAINSSLMYLFSSSLAIVQNSTEWNPSNITSFELTGFLPFASSMLSWKTVFATGGEKNAFVPLTTSAGNMDGSVPYSGHIKTGLVSTFLPVDGLLFLLEPDVFFNVMNNDTDKGYAGFQWMTSVKYSVTSDFNFVASVGQFYPAAKGAKSYLNANLGLSFMF